MKAKDYAERYNDNPTPEVLGKIALDMLVETRSLLEQRNSKSNEALFGVLNEIDLKWRAFVNLVNVDSLNPNGFELLISIELPEVSMHWQYYRNNKRSRHGR